jgi:hypothetical protein
VTSADLEQAWNAVHDASPLGWEVGRPAYLERRNEWQMHAFDTNDRGKPGKPRTREWTAIASSEVGVVLEMARCLRVIGEGGCPR